MAFEAPEGVTAAEFYVINPLELPANPAAWRIFTTPRPGGEEFIVDADAWAASVHAGSDAPLPGTFHDTDLVEREATATAAFEIAATSLGDKVSELEALLALIGGSDGEEPTDG